jgi:hypothetical protein
MSCALIDWQRDKVTVCQESVTARYWLRVSLTKPPWLAPPLPPHPTLSCTPGASSLFLYQLFVTAHSPCLYHNTHPPPPPPRLLLQPILSSADLKISFGQISTHALFLHFLHPVYTSPGHHLYINSHIVSRHWTRVRRNGHHVRAQTNPETGSSTRPPSAITLAKSGSTTGRMSLHITRLRRGWLQDKMRLRFLLS